MTSIEAWAPGTTFSMVVIDNLTRSQIVQYAGASGDFNPIHTDEVYATRVAGLPSVFGHGMLTMGSAGSFLHSLVGPPHLRSFSVRFAEKVWPGDTLTAAAVVTTLTEGVGSQLLIDLDVAVTNQDDGVVLLGQAQATVPHDFLPGRPGSTPTRSENTRA